MSTLEEHSLAAELKGKRVGVILSSAYFGFFGHTGFMRALGELGLRPAALAGTSAGALVAAFAAVDGGLAKLETLLSTVRRRDFWDPALRPSKHKGPPGLLRGQRFADLLTTHLPVTNFEDCDIPLVTVSTNLTRQARHLDTQGALAVAVQASCALPLLFRPVYRKGEAHVDGGLLDKVPVRALLETVPDLDAILVHLLPSSALSKPFPRDPWGYLNAALDLVRDDAWQQQAAWAEAKGVAVYTITSHLPRLGPFRLKKGPAVIAEAEQQVLRALS